MLGIGTQAMRITGNVFNLLVMVNCAANFILYSALSTKFRATFSRLFCSCGTASPDSSCHRRCCCVHAYGPAAGRDVNPADHTTVTGRYASLPAARPGGRRGGGRSTASTTIVGDSDNEDVCSCLLYTSPSPRD